MPHERSFSHQATSQKPPFADYSGKEKRHRIDEGNYKDLKLWWSVPILLWIEIDKRMELDRERKQQYLEREEIDRRIGEKTLEEEY